MIKAKSIENESMKKKLLKKINKHCSVQSTQMLLGRQSGSIVV
jgi:hypothetical protein